MPSKKTTDKPKILNVKSIEKLISRCAGYVTDAYEKDYVFTSAHLLPKKATKIKFRFLKDDKKTFELTEWFLIDRKKLNENLYPENEH